MVRNLHWQTWRIREPICRECDGTFLRIRSSNISCLQCLWERRITKQRRRKEVNTLQWSPWKHRVASPHSDFCESAQYLRSNGRFLQRSTQRSKGSGETCSTWSLGKDGNSYRPLYCRKFYQCTATKKPGARIRAEIRTIVRRPEIIQTVFWCGFEACRIRTILQNSWYRRRTTDATFLPRIHDASEKRTRKRGWILKNTRIGPVLNIEVCYHDDRYSIEVQIPSLFQDNPVSWVGIVNGVDKYVTESMLTTKEEDIVSGKPIAKAGPRQKPTVTLTSVSIPVLETDWIDIETQRSHDHKCYEVSKAITRLLRHDQTVSRGSDGAIHYSDIFEECRKKKFDDASQWLLGDWIYQL